VSGVGCSDSAVTRTVASASLRDVAASVRSLLVVRFVVYLTTLFSNIHYTASNERVISE
jgi:hypothetical protein